MRKIKTRIYNGSDHIYIWKKGRVYIACAPDKMVSPSMTGISQDELERAYEEKQLEGEWKK